MQILARRMGGRKHTGEGNDTEPLEKHKKEMRRVMHEGLVEHTHSEHRPIFPSHGFPFVVHD